MWSKSILELIGQTPMVELSRVTEGVLPVVLAKVEYFNPGNSSKDRIALKMIEAAEQTGRLQPGGTVVENTSGNTGLAVAMVCVRKGYRCVCVMRDSVSREKIDAICALGAEVVLCPASASREHPLSYESTAARLATEIKGAVHLNQYFNPANAQAHYETLGPEIWAQTEGRITHFVSVTGTCGTLCGAAAYLKEQNPAIQVIGVDNPGSVLKPFFDTGVFDPSEAGAILTEGVGRHYIPGAFRPDVIDEIVHVNDAEGAVMARSLAREEGLFVGWSSGAAVAGALKVACKQTPASLMVVVLPDHGSRYLGKIFNDDWMDAKGLFNREQLVRNE